MVDSGDILDMISGRRKGLLAGIVRTCLWSLTPVYRIGRWAKQRKFNGNANANSNIHRVTVPVISVGNLTTGGTGKTPHVIWLCQHIRRHGWRVAILSRGYGAPQGSGGSPGRNDEALEMDKRLPDVPHLQNPDRVRSAAIAIEELETQCIVLDDGFQHRRLGRDLDIVLIDATNPFGYGYLLPRGLLREPVAGLRRADVIVITRCHQSDAETVASIRQTAQHHCPHAVLATSETRPSRWIQYDGREWPADHLSGQRVLICTAIGNPDSFIKTVAETSAIPISGTHLIFPDHHLFTRQDMDTIATAAADCGAAAIVCTHKDLVKIAVNQIGGIPLFALTIDLHFLTGENELIESVNDLLK